MAEEIRRDFRRWQKKHPNFMTPHIDKLFIKGEDVVEVSSGRGIDNREIYGVTHMKRLSTGNFKTEGGEMFYSRDIALEVAKEKLKKVV